MSFVHTPIGSDPVEFGADADGQVIIQVLGGAGGGGAASWGDITGTLADQEDLQAALDTKASAASLGAIVATVNAHTDAIEALDEGKANRDHTHTLSQITDAGTAAAADTEAFDAAGTAASAVEAHAEETQGPHGISEFGATVIAAADAATARGLLGVPPATAYGSEAQVPFVHAEGDRFVYGQIHFWADTNVLRLGTSGPAPSIQLRNRGELRLCEAASNGTNYIGLRAPASVTSDVTLTLPGTAGSAGQHLATNGSGMLSWAWTPLSPLTLTVDGGGSVITDSEYPCFVGADCELLTVGLLADQAGDIEITLTRVRGETPLELGTVTLSAAESVTPAPITGWAATDLLASDILIAVVHGASDLTRVVLSLGRRAA